MNEELKRISAAGQSWRLNIAVNSWDHGGRYPDRPNPVRARPSRTLIKDLSFFKRLARP
jgi:hypothetical protein